MIQSNLDLCNHKTIKQCLLKNNGHNLEQSKGSEQYQITLFSTNTIDQSEKIAHFTNYRAKMCFISI